MIYQRRGLLLKLFLTAGAVQTVVRAAQKKVFHPDKKFKASFTCPMIGTSGGRFEDYQRNWENPEQIEQINKRYQANGQLLEIHTLTDYNQYTWSYVFSNRLSYEDWSREIFLSGAFSPFKVDKQFNYKLEEKYV